MKKHIRVLSVFMAVLLLIPLTVIFASAESGNYGPFTYTVDDGEVTIASCSKALAAKDVEVPAMINNLPVTEIGLNAFIGNDSIESVKLPASIKKIGAYAFYNCKNLETVYVPSSVNDIDEYAFHSSPELVVNCENNSAAQIYCKAQNVPYICWNTDFTVSPAVLTFKPSETELITAYEIAPESSPVDFADDEFVWKSGNTAVVTVIKNLDGTGLVTAVKDGSTTIYLKKGAAVYATCKVTVRTPVTSVSLTEDYVVLDISKTRQLTAAVLPAAATDKTLTWTSSDESVATVSAAGLVKAIGKGEAIITVTSNDGSFSDYCVIDVVVPVTSVSLSRTSVSLNSRDSYTLSASVLPKEAESADVTWISSNPAVATVDQNGLVRALRRGTATITAISDDNPDVKAVCTVTVSYTWIQWIIIILFFGQYWYFN